MRPTPRPPARSYLLSGLRQDQGVPSDPRRSSSRALHGHLDASRAEGNTRTPMLVKILPFLITLLVAAALVAEFGHFDGR